MRAALGYDRSYTNSQMGRTMPKHVNEMLAQDNANENAIESMRKSGFPYYWVNVGVRKFFTDDLNTAITFTRECGDSLYEGDENYIGMPIAIDADPGEAGFAETETPKPKPHGIRFCADQFNNVRRMCSVFGTNQGRVWKVRAAMRDAGGNRFYMVRHINTGESRVVSSNDMTNLY